MAPAIFYLRGIAPPEITIHDMFLGVVPFIIVQLMSLGIVAAYPPLVLWLPWCCSVSSEDGTVSGLWPDTVSSPKPLSDVSPRRWS
jgi:hypothetical protein